MLADQQQQQDADDEGSIEVVPQKPKRRTRLIQRRSTLDPDMLRGTDAPRRPSTRKPTRRGSTMTAKHRSEPAVAFSYSNECLSSSISDLDSDADDLIGGILTHRYDAYVSDDVTGEGALILPRGEDGTTTSGAEALMTIGDLCASLIPPKIVSKSP